MKQISGKGVQTRSLSGETAYTLTHGLGRPPFLQFKRSSDDILMGLEAAGATYDETTPNVIDITFSPAFTGTLYFY